MASHPRSLIVLFASALVLATGCGNTDQNTATAIEPSSKRYSAETSDGTTITLWIVRLNSPEGGAVVDVQLDDPLEHALLGGRSQALALDSLRVNLELPHGGQNLLKGMISPDGPLHLAYTRGSAPAPMELDFKPEQEDIVFTPRTVEKHIEPVKEAEAAEDGIGYEELGIAELGQDISLNVFTITRADGSKHPLDSVLELFVCENTGRYDDFIASKKDGPFSYELGTTILYRDSARVCLKVFMHEQWPGAAHGMFESWLLNYDLRSGEEFGLWDVIDRKKRGTLIAACAKAFYAQHPDKDKRDFPFKLTENIALLRDGIMFIYPPYEMGPFAEGEVSFFVPFASLAALMRPGTSFFTATQ